MQTAIPLDTGNELLIVRFISAILFFPLLSKSLLASLNISICQIGLRASNSFHPAAVKLKYAFLSFLRCSSRLSGVVKPFPQCGLIQMKNLFQCLLSMTSLYSSLYWYVAIHLKSSP
jgi:hypothetical protein